MIVKVLINTSIKTLNKVYDYLVPENLEKDMELGKRVVVNFGRGNDRTEEGLIVKIFKSNEQIDVKYKLKEIISVLDEVSYINEFKLKLAKWMSHIYFCNVFDAIKLMLPPGTTSKKSKKNLNTKQTIRISLNKNVDEILEDIDSLKIKSAKQIQLLKFLIDNEFVLINDIVEGLNISRAIVNTVEKNGYINLEKIDIENDNMDLSNIPRSSPLKLTYEQITAKEKILESVYKKEYEKYLLFGVTGSGKTEVYLQVIEEVLKQGKTVIVLVPEISLTYQTVNRFAARFGDNIALLHSKMTISQRKEEYKKIMSGKVNIVIGARSAIFAPIKNLGLVIIDEEHDTSYYSMTTPKYSTKEVASYICSNNNAVLLLGSATPEISTYYKAQSDEIKLLELLNRPGNSKLPQIDIIDIKNEKLNGNFSILSYKLKEEILLNIKNKEQTMILLNKRGYNNFLICKDCSYIFKCKNCDVSLTYHKKNDLLLCHYCSHVERNVHKCPKCGGQNITQGGIGTEKLEEELKEIYKDIKVIRMDADTTITKDSYQNILDDFRSNKADVLIGTQMISKGHDIENVTLVGVLGVDSMLAMNDFLASERTYSNISQVSGRAGRGEKLGRVIIQTSDMENYILDSVIKHDYVDFFNKEIEYRKLFEYPPFIDIILIELIGNQINILKSEATKLYDILNLNSNKMYKVFSPKSPYIEKVNNKYRVNIIIKCKINSELLKTIYINLEKFNKIKGKQTKVIVTKNPIYIG